MQFNTKSEYFDSCNVTVLKKKAASPDIELVYKQKNFGRNRECRKGKKLFDNEISVAEIISNNLIKEHGNKNE